MTPSLRYAVMERDGFRCRLCGATAAEGAQLEVDHIIPVARGGRTEMCNLQTLCWECNHGKGAKMPSREQVDEVIRKGAEAKPTSRG